MLAFEVSARGLDVTRQPQLLDRASRGKRPEHCDCAPNDDLAIGSHSERYVGTG